MNLLRQIDNEVKTLWDKSKTKNKLNHPIEDCPPSLLKGWTDDNLSLWEIDHPDKPNLESILVALCRQKKGNWDKITYLQFNRNVVDNARLNLTQTNGNTGETRIDLSKTHYEIQNITAKELCTLIYYIMISSFQIGLFKKTDFDGIILKVYDAYQKVEQKKLKSMSTEPKPIQALAETEKRDITIKEESINREQIAVSSASIDPSSGFTSSSTST